MAKTTHDPDVLVVGDHPSAAFVAALLRQNSSLRVVRCAAPGETFLDRLVTINPEFFDLHPILSPLKKKLDLAPFYGLRFIADDPATSGEYRGKPIAGYVTALKPVKGAMEKLADDADVETVRNKSLRITGVDEHGVTLKLDEKTLKAKLLVVAGPLDADAKRALGLAPGWDTGVLHRYTYLKCKTSAKIIPENDATKDMIPMSLDLHGHLRWAWMLSGAGHVQFAVEEPIDDAIARRSPAELLEHWLKILSNHGVIKSGDAFDASTAISIDLPLAGALAQEGVGNRAVLMGPAGGFFTACAEEIYPTCWSALFAADAVKKALKEKHPQDALQPYRHKWGATLGDYLRGPQQNLRFLLPLVYRNKVMTARLAEAILFGKSVVR